MMHRAAWRITLAFALLTLFGCEGKTGPATTSTKSADLSTHAERVEFLERYVSFRRSYETLDFTLDYLNTSGGMVPGPTDYEIRLIATVPESELAEWIPTNIPPDLPPTDINWLRAVPTSVKVDGIDEWYVEHQRVIGIDRARSVVVYRIWTH